MKKGLMLIVGISILGALLSGCTSAGVQSPTGFSSVIGPAFYSGVTFPSHLQQTSLAGRKYKVLIETDGYASTKSFFFMFATGDGGLKSAIDDALARVKGADDLIDIKIDTEVTNIFWMFTRCTTHVYGKAIKYTDNGEVK